MYKLIVESTHLIVVTDRENYRIKFLQLFDVVRRQITKLYPALAVKMNGDIRLVTGRNSRSHFVN